ncbi:MAG: hypothetical protein ACREQ4_15450 [Candidatus Binataceae bacterium]
MADVDSQPSDRNEIAVARWHRRMCAALRPLITPDLIAEHARDPLGDHSDALKRVLNYIRRTDINGALVVICSVPFKEWRVARLAAMRERAPAFIDSHTFASEAEAMHAVFLMRVEEITRD